MMRYLPQPEEMIPTILFMGFVALVSLFIEEYGKRTGRWK
jgi:hypothetical protein